MQLLDLRLPAELDEFVQSKVASGDFADQAEVVRSALWQMRQRDLEREARLAELRELIRPALEALDRGEGQPHTGMDEIWAEVVRRLDAKQR